MLPIAGRPGLDTLSVSTDTLQSSPSSSPNPVIAICRRRLSIPVQLNVVKSTDFAGICGTE